MEVLVSLKVWTMFCINLVGRHKAYYMDIILVWGFWVGKYSCITFYGLYPITCSTWLHGKEKFTMRNQDILGGGGFSSPLDTQKCTHYPKVTSVTLQYLGHHSHSAKQSSEFYHTSGGKVHEKWLLGWAHKTCLLSSYTHIMVHFHCINSCQSSSLDSSIKKTN